MSVGRSPTAESLEPPRATPLDAGVFLCRGKKGDIPLFAPALTSILSRTSGAKRGMSPLFPAGLMMKYLQKLPLLPTSVIGSLPRPAWLLDLLEDYLAGRLSRREWDRACDHAIPFAVALQE